MDNLFQNNSGEKTEHPPREMLLLFVDGELQVREAAQLETHLEACWPCRVKTQKIQDAIADIIEFDDQVLTPRLVPPQNWRNFDRELSELVAACGKQGFSSRVFGSLGRFLPLNRLFSFPRPLFARIVRDTAVVVLFLIVVALVIHFRREPTVSASELLRNVIDAQAQQINRTSEAVVHQKLRIATKGQSREQTIDWEIWNDTKNSRVRQFLVEGNRPIPVTTDSSTTQNQKVNSAGDLINEFAQVLKANHMDPARPLSASSYQSWHNSLQHQRDEITKSKLADGNDALRLRTVAASPVNKGQIVEATFIVRARDWLPAELQLHVAAEGGNQIYELTAMVSEVVSLTQIDPVLFADQPVLNPSPASSPKEIAKTEVQPTPAPDADPQPLNSAPLATADLEVEALRLLNQAGADLGEQITVKRQADGLLHIPGIVETDQRRNEIVKALGPIAGNPAIRIEIQTVAEAVAKQSSSKPTPPPSTRDVEITSNMMAAEPELRAYFAGKGKDTDEAIRQYAARMVGLSNRAMDHVWATKRLLNQFSPEEVGALTPEARSKWIGLIRSHCRAYQGNIESIRRELRPIFFPGQSLGTPSQVSPITDTNELAQTVNQLFELGSSNDRVIRSAFTSSSGGVMTTVIKTPQFWQSLNNAETLAARIAQGG